MVFSSRPHCSEVQLLPGLSNRVSVGQLYDSGMVNFRVKFVRTTEVELAKALVCETIYRKRQDRVHFRLYSRNLLIKKS